MTDTSTSTRTGFRADFAILIAIAGVALLVVLYFMSQSKQVLRSSPAGFDGLQAWLSSEDVEAQSFSGGWLLDSERYGLLIVTVFDRDLTSSRVAPKTKEEFLLQQDEYDLWLDALTDKLDRVPSLVVLPKWRSGMRLTGLGHPVLLVEPKATMHVLRRVTGDTTARIRYARTPFTQFDAPDGIAGQANIYAAQMFQSAGCEPIIGRESAMLLGDCPIGGDDENRVLILSDPDLLSNHGLRLGQNAEIARDFIASRTDEKAVLIDYSPRYWFAEEENVVLRERTWSDLLKFFEQPFLALWLGAALAMALTLWRAALRFGPIPAETTQLAASKAFAIEARARLMRLADCDGALVAEYARARIGTVASSLFGPAYARHYSRPETFATYVKRRDAKLGESLSTVLSDIEKLPDRIPPTEAIQLVDQLEILLERVTHDT